MKEYTAFKINCDRCGVTLIDSSSDCECYFISNVEAYEACIRQGWLVKNIVHHFCPKCQKKFKEKR